jgi:hypothetical protein
MDRKWQFANHKGQPPWASITSSICFMIWMVSEFIKWFQPHDSVQFLDGSADLVRNPFEFFLTLSAAVLKDVRLDD